MIKLARKNAGAAPIANRIANQTNRNPVVWGEPRGQTPHTIGAKRFNLGFFVLMFVVSHILKILKD